MVSGGIYEEKLALVQAWDGSGAASQKEEEEKNEELFLQLKSPRLELLRLLEEVEES